MRCGVKLSVAEYCGQRMYKTLAIVALVTRHSSVERYDTAAYRLCTLVAGQFYVCRKGPGSPFVASTIGDLPSSGRLVRMKILHSSVCPAYVSLSQRAVWRCAAASCRR